MERGMKRVNASSESRQAEDALAEALLDSKNFHALVAHLKSCAKQKDMFKGNRLHAYILNRGLLKENTLIGSTLISMYANCGALAIAQQVFDELPLRDVVSWN
eukprot:c24391_g3_i1 orf=314-622(+)